MQLPPLEIIESFPLPNYDDPVTRGPANIIMNLVLFPMVCLAIFLRIYTRLRISKSFGADDWLILASLFPTTAFTAISLLAELHFGWNRHVWDVEVDSLSLGLKLAMTTQVLFSIATTLTKCSMLALTYRIIESGSRRFGWFIIGAMFLIAAESVAFCFTVLFQCKPSSDYWTLSFKPQHCISETKNLLAAGTINTITDLLVVTLPIPSVWGLNLPLRQQVILVLLFGAGFLVTIAGIVRTIYTFRVTNAWDKTWLAYPVWLASSVELYVGIICASVPATKKFFSRYIPMLLGSSKLTSNTRTMPSNPSYSKHSNPSYSIPSGEVEFGQHENIELDSPYDVERTREPGVVHAHQTESFDTSLSSFNVSGVERLDTAESSRSTGTYGMFDGTKTDSDDELVASQHARTSYRDDFR